MNMIDDLEKKEKQKSPNLINKKLKKHAHPTLRFWGKVFLVLAIALVGVGISLGVKVVMSISSHEITGDGEKISFFQQISHLFSKQGDKINGEKDDRINILLLGVGGYGHQGSLLTDTIIMLSFKPSTKQVAMLSIPRDLTVEYPGNYYWRKINNAIAFGLEMEYPGGGEALAVDLVEDVTGQEIHYYGRIDFAGFEQIIDGLGGIKINVENSFVDYTYPTDDYGLQTLSFTAGEQIMDGETALKYVRSRHGTNGEGSDFARAKRQQKVLLALKNKFTSFSTLINPQKISEILSTLGTHTKTDLEIWEMLKIYNLSQNIKEDNIINFVIDNSPGGYLKTEVGLEGAYILVPSADDFSEIHDLSENIFSYQEIKKEEATISIQNGTSQAGLAQEKAEGLIRNDYNIIDIGNYDNNKVKQTFIYDLTGGQIPDTIDSLRSDLNAPVYSNLPLMLKNFDPKKAMTLNLDYYHNLDLKKFSDLDILVVLGRDSINNQVLSYY